MAEYAGLEIRIGGNTTKLTNALKAPTKSAAELQSRIREITRAMQFDPTDLKNVDTRVKITGDRMQALQSKIQLTRTAMEQLGESTVTFGGSEIKVKKLADETENLSLKAKQADERFNGLTGSLAKIYETWNKLGRREGVDFAKDKLGIDEQTARRLMSTKTSLDEFKTTLAEINRQRESGFDFAPVMSPDEIKTITDLKKLNFHGMFERGFELKDMVEEAERLGVTIDETAVANVRELQAAFKEAQQDKEALDKALQKEQGETSLKRMESEVESLSQTMRQLDDSLTGTTMSDEFQEIEAQVRTLDAALDNVEADLKRTGEAIDLDPGNIQLAARYVDDLKQKSELSQEKMGLLQREMDMLNADGASEAAKGHQDLAKWIEESAEAARVAKKELSDQQATVTNLDDQTKSLSQTIAQMKGDSTFVQLSDNVLEWQSRTQKLTKEMADLDTETDKVAKQQKALDQAQANFDKASKEADELKSSLESLEEELRQVEAAYTEAFDASGGIDTDGSLTEMYNNLQEVKAAVEQVEIAYGGAQVNVKEFSKQLDDQESRTKTAQSSLELQRTAVEELKASISELEQTKEVRLFQNPTGEIEKTEAELVDLQAELEQARTKEKELAKAYDSAKTENELAKTSSALRDVSQEADKTSADLKSVADELKVKGNGILNASTVKSLGMTLSATLTPTITAIGYKVMSASSDVDSAYRDMRKTVEGTEEQFEALRTSAIEFSRTHVTSADQILQIEAIGGELGIATENLETFAEVISNIDVATNLDAEGAAEALGHLANILHLSEDDYVGFSDALVRLGNNGASTETEIANIAERIGSMGSIVGMSGSDILAWASTIASTGQNAEAAATAISKTMSFMETAVAAAGGTMDTSFESINAAVEEGGDKLTVFASLAGMTAEEFAESWETNAEEMAESLNTQLGNAKDSLQRIADIAHMSADEFAKTWESDPTAALEAFIRGLNDIEGAEGSADKVLQDLGITAVRQKQAIEGLMQTIGGLDKNLEMSENAWNGISDRWGQAGDAANEAAKKAEGFSGQLQILKNNAQVLLSELGQGALPWIQMISNGVQGLTQLFSSLSEETKKWVVFTGGIGAALGPLLSFGATFVTSKNEFMEWFETTTSDMNLVKLAYKHGGGDITSALDGTISTMGKVKLVGAELGSALVKGLAVAAVVVAIGRIAMELKSLYDRYKDHIVATKGLNDALSNIGASADVASRQFDLTGSSLRNLAADSRDYESRLADLTRTIEDSNRQYGSYAGQMDYYAETIGRLGGKADLTQGEAYKLEAALQAVNDACGTHYGLDEYGNIIDTETGKIQENTDAIIANIEMRKQQALIDYYSDDYKQAVGEQAEAQDKLNDAEAYYNDLVSDAGRREYFENARKVYGSTYDEAKVQAAYNREVEDANTAIQNYSKEVERTSEVVDTLDAKISDATEGMRESQKVLDDAAKAQEAYDLRSTTVAGDVTGNMKKLSDAVTALGGSDSSFNSIASGLTSIHVFADELGGVDMSKLVSSFGDVDGSMQDIIATLEQGGVHMYTWNSALEQAPGAAEKMGSITASAFQSMYEIAGSSLEQTMTLIAGLDEVQVGDKTFYIGDNGSIVDSQGKIYNIQADLAAIPDEVITAYYVDNSEAQQKALETKAELTAVGNQNPTPTLNVSDHATPTVTTLQNKLTGVHGFTANPSAYLRDYASGGINGIRSNLLMLDGNHATVTVTTVERTVKQATGGLNNRPVIPRHATGYIATGPTLTNQGWIGEDGVEAVANWATGGAVVPLTNKKYMLPIADAIAEGMTSRLDGAGTGAPVYNITVHAEGNSGNEIAQAITRELRAYQLMTGGR